MTSLRYHYYLIATNLNWLTSRVTLRRRSLVNSSATSLTSCASCVVATIFDFTCSNDVMRCKALKYRSLNYLRLKWIASDPLDFFLQVSHLPLTRHHRSIRHLVLSLHFRHDACVDARHFLCANVVICFNKLPEFRKLRKIFPVRETKILLLNLKSKTLKRSYCTR